MLSTIPVINLINCLISFYKADIQLFIYLEQNVIFTRICIIVIMFIQQLMHIAVKY